MESNWRWRVAELGMAGLGYNLFAWLVDEPDRLISNVPGFPTGSYFKWHFFADTGLPGAPEVFIRPGEHFPYGLNVEPDRP